MSALMPSEHGGYGMLVFPIVTALLLPGAGAPALELAAAFLLGYLSHRAVLIATGLRRAPDPRCRDAAVRVAMVLSSGAAGLLVHAVGRSPAPVAWSLTVPMLGVAALFAIVARQQERTSGGELFAAVALSSCSIPVTVAAGGGAAAALVFALVWTFGFAMVTLALRSVIERARPARASRFRAIAMLTGGAGAMLLIALAATGRVPGLAPLAQLPLLGLATRVALHPAEPPRLKAIGWSLVAACTLTLGALACF